MTLEKLFYFAIGAILATLISFKVFTAPKFAYVNVEKVIQDIVGKINKDRLPKEKIEEEIAKHKKAFEDAITNYSKEHKVILFSSPKPIAGATDITDHFTKVLQ